MLTSKCSFPPSPRGQYWKLYSNQKLEVIHSYSPWGIKAWNFQRSKNLHAFGKLILHCYRNREWPDLPLLLTSILPNLYHLLKCPVQKETVHLDRVWRYDKQNIAVLAKVSQSRNRDENVSEKETKKLRFCWNAEGEIFLTAYVPSSQCKHSVRYKSLTKPLRFDFYLSNYCQHILYISFKRLNPIFQFIKLFPTFTEFISNQKPIWINKNYSKSNLKINYLKFKPRRLLMKEFSPI